MCTREQPCDMSKKHIAIAHIGMYTFPVAICPDSLRWSSSHLHMRCAWPTYVSRQQVERAEAARARVQVKSERVEVITVHQYTGARAASAYPRFDLTWCLRCPNIFYHQREQTEAARKQKREHAAGCCHGEMRFALFRCWLQSRTEASCMSDHGSRQLQFVVQFRRR